MINFLKNIFSSNSPEEETQEIYNFDKVPDGKYLVRYSKEIGDNKRIIIIFEILIGKYKNSKIPLFFSGKDAKIVLNEAKAGFISRLAMEGNKNAIKIEDSIKEGDLEKTDFLVRVKENEVGTIYSNENNEINLFRKKVEQDQNFLGYNPSSSPKEKLINSSIGNRIELFFNLKKELIDKDVTVKGSQDYIINLKNLTCSCENFKKERGNFKINEIRRACKHLLNYLKSYDYLGEHDEITKAILENYSIPASKYITKFNMNSGEIVIIFHGKDEWVEIYTRKRKKGDSEGTYSGKYDRFSYNINEKRWSYGSNPPGASEIKQMIERLDK